MEKNRKRRHPSLTESINPATGEVIGHFRVHTANELKKSVRKAREAQKTWGGLPIKERVRMLSAIRDHLVDHTEEIATVISKETGKTRIEAMSTEVMPAIMALHYYLRKAPKFLKPKILFPGSLPLANKWSKIVRVPYGVVGIISPWNYPFAIPFSEVIMGLLGGNAIVLKTATKSQLTGKTLEACIEASHLPKGTFSLINMPGRRAGDAFFKAGIDKLFFTGSVAVGKKLMAKAAETLTPITLELGGKDAMLVCEDADLDRASSGALWAGFSNCGQSCAGVERIYVHEAIYEPFLEKLKARVEALRVGPDVNHDVDMGAMTTKDQIEKVRSHLEDALAKRAEIYAQSPMPAAEKQGHFSPATILTRVHHRMRVMQEETFGPVVAVMKVRLMDEAVALANDSLYGLTASVWSKNVRRAEQIGKKIQAGAVTINDHQMSHGMPETSWGGFKASGIGRTHGRIGFDEMTQPQVIVHDLLYFTKKSLWWPPYSQRLYQGLIGAVNVFYARKHKNRLAGLRALLKIFPRVFKNN